MRTAQAPLDLPALLVTSREPLKTSATTRSVRSITSRTREGRKVGCAGGEGDGLYYITKMVSATTWSVRLITSRARGGEGWIGEGEKRMILFYNKTYS